MAGVLLISLPISFLGDVFDILSLSPSNHYLIYFKSYKAE